MKKEMITHSSEIKCVEDLGRVVLMAGDKLGLIKPKIQLPLSDLETLGAVRNYARKYGRVLYAMESNNQGLIVTPFGVYKCT